MSFFTNPETEIHRIEDLSIGETDETNETNETNEDLPQEEKPPEDSILKTKPDGRKKKGKERSPAQIAAFEKMKLANQARKAETQEIKTRSERIVQSQKKTQKPKTEPPVLKRSEGNSIRPSRTVIHNYYYAQGHGIPPEQKQVVPDIEDKEDYADTASESSYYSSDSEEDEQPKPNYQNLFG